MESYKRLKTRAQLSVLRDVQREYPGRTIENIIQNMESIVKFHKEHEDS